MCSPYAWVPSSSLLADPEESSKSGSKTTDTIETDNLSSWEEPSPTSDAQAPSSSGMATSTSKVSLPTNWPSRIVPQTQSKNVTSPADDADDSDSDDDDADADTAITDSDGTVSRPANSTLVSVLLTPSLSWSWLLSNSNASAQIFAYMPVLLANKLDLPQTSVLTDSLEAYEPPNWRGNDKDVRSVWLGYVPTSKVDSLAQMIVDTQSALYDKGSDITAQLVRSG